MRGKRRIKRVQRVAGGAWLLISDNPRYEKELIKPEDMKDVEILSARFGLDGFCKPPS